MYDILQLNDMLVPELLDIADQLKISNAKKLDKQELVYKILDKQAVTASEVKQNGMERPKRKRIIKATTANTTEEAEVMTEPAPAPVAVIAPEPAPVQKEEVKLKLKVNGHELVQQLEQFEDNWCPYNQKKDAHNNRWGLPVTSHTGDVMDNYHLNSFGHMQRYHDVEMKEENFTTPTDFIAKHNEVQKVIAYLNKYIEYSTYNSSSISLSES